MSSPGRLDGKRALVTGAGRGIGRVLAIGLAAEGAIVDLVDLDDPGTVLAELPASRRGLALRCDVADATEIRTMFSKLDRLDVLVNCAGVTGWMDAVDPSEATWDRVIDTNLKGTFFCSIAAARLMREGGRGSIINVSSVLATRGMPNSAAYAASKGGINALTVQLAIELAPDRIRVNAFAPGATNVERNLVDDPSYLEVWAPLIPLGRVAEPEEMVGPAVFLASDDSAQVTGQLLYVDGGWTATGTFPSSYVDRTARADGKTDAS
jgi:glucose 1-dehydrogenase